MESHRIPQGGTSRGGTYDTGCVHVAREVVDAEIAERLHLTEGDGTVNFEWKILLGGRLIAYIRDVIPQDILSSEEITAGFKGSVLQVIKESKLVVGIW